MDLEPNSNPLAKHFRQPALYTSLVSGGRFWPEGSINLPVTGEVPVYPMTAKDEITLRTPDALLNGTAVVEIIHSCCPVINNAWEMPSVDVDALLIAIRIASYGESMTTSSKCPQCGEEHDYSINLQSALAGVQMPDYQEPLEIDNLMVYFKPLNYRQVSKTGQKTYEEERLILSLADDSIDDEEKKRIYDEHVERMIDLNIDSLVNYTDAIVTEDGVAVSNPAHIKEFYANTKAANLKQIEKRAASDSTKVNIQPMDAKCKACDADFKLTMTFDYASFFATGS
jgi:DNA-directed RNA polymerase subunit M/transcription elongation factor TFIIS